MLPGGLEEEEFANLRYEIHKDRFNIAFTGAIALNYGIKLLVDSVIMLHEKYSHIRLLLFGAMAPLDEETKRKISESKKGQTPWNSDLPLFCTRVRRCEQRAIW